MNNIYETNIKAQKFENPFCLNQKKHMGTDKNIRKKISKIFFIELYLTKKAQKINELTIFFLYLSKSATQKRTLDVFVKLELLCITFKILNFC